MLGWVLFFLGAAWGSPSASVPTFDDLQNVWIRASTSCDPYPSLSKMLRLINKIDSNMPISARMEFFGNRFQATIYAAPACFPGFSVAAGVGPTDNQALYCSQPVTVSGQITYDEHAGILSMQVDENRDSHTSFNIWGMNDDSVHVQMLSSLLILRTQNHAACPDDREWWTYWIPVPKT